MCGRIQRHENQMKRMIDDSRGYGSPQGRRLLNLDFGSVLGLDECVGYEEEAHVMGVQGRSSYEHDVVSLQSLRLLA
jgi:hypothetical protein